MRETIIIDTDPGQDDAVALLLAFASTDRLDLKAITTVAGNVPVAQTTTNALRIRDLEGQIPLVSVDGGQESFERIADPNSTFMATVSIPFEEMGKKAVDAIQTIVVDKKPKEAITNGPYLFMDAVLVDKNNVEQFLKK